MIADELLARRIQQGDSSAIGGIVERHYDSLLGYLYRMTGGDRPLAEDLVQDTFVRALRSIAQYQHPRPFKPWLYAIATNLARNHYKSADQRYTQNADDDLPEVADDHAIDEPLTAQEDAQAVIDALRALPDHQREVIILYYYQSLNMNEIAEALHIPLGTVKSRLSIGITRLRAAIKEAAHGT